MAVVATVVHGNSVEVFCSYAHEDEPLRQEFESSVALMRRKKQIDVWHDRRIAAGDNWADKIDEHLDSADIIALFVSRDFLASDYCYEKELCRALERESRKEAVVIPILVRDCDWSDAPFAKLQGIPSGKAVTSWPNRDEAWTAVARALKETVLGVLQRKEEKLKALAPGGNLEPGPLGIPIKGEPGGIAAMDPSTLTEQFSADQKQAQEIYEQIRRDAARWKPERERLMAQMQARIFALQDDLKVDSRQTKRAEMAFNNLDKYIRG